MTQAAAPQTVRKRSEIPEKYRWRLEDIYATDEAWEADFRAVQSVLPRFESYKGRLGESPATLAECLNLRFETEERFMRLLVYAYTRRDEDSTNPKYQAIHDRAQRLGIQLSTAVSFIEPELLQLPQERLEQYMAAEELKLYRHYLDDLLRHKPHTLSPQEEAILAAAGELALAPSNVFGMFNDADLKFPFIKDEQGREVEVTHGRYLRLMESRDRRVRHDAFKALHGTYYKWRNTIAATYAASVRKDVFYAKIRKFESSLHAALHEDNVPVEVYTNLIDAVHSRLDLLHRYVRLRKKLLGVDELHMYDLYVPLVPEVEFNIPYEEAAEKMLAGLAPLGEEYVRVVRHGLENRWVDVYENEGKRSGAYSTSAYGVHPYILMNYENNLDNLFTLAHEFGHAMHSYLADGTQPYVYSQPTIFVAEVASTLNENLLFHYLIKTTESPEQRRYLINNFLDTIRGTVFRQVKFAEFEKLTHERVESGEALTADWMSEQYYNLVKQYYGPDIVADEEIAIEWARIPHFYRAFYVYKYATGFAAATALANAILKEGEPAVQRYLEMLRRGGSDYPLNLLKDAGVDMTTPEPILQVMNVFEELLNELEALS
ncbi:MAG: oligoendopeptidase F [Limnochordales bacterium]|jgi:oligoendopeptidase F|nr:oligoendopeptidase F [Bacillota bacterium]